MMTRKRLVALDLLRGLALLGIMANHVFYLSAHPIAAVMQDYHAIAFFLLSGIVFTYAAKERALPNIVRGIICIILGLVLAAGQPPVDIILVNYGIMFIIASATVPRLSTRALGILGLILLIASPVISMLLRGGLGMESQPEGVAGMLLRPFLYGHYPLLQWSAVFFIGAGIGRLLVAGHRFSPASLIGFGAVVFVLTKVVSYFTAPSGTPLFKMGDGNVGASPAQELLSSYAYGGTTYGLVASMSVVIFAWGVLSWIEERWSRSVSRYVGWLSALGQATLSVYVFHVLIVLLVDIPDSAWLGVLYYGVQVAGFVLMVTLWHRFSLPSRGPLEAATQYVVRMEESKPAR